MRKYLYLAIVAFVAISWFWTGGYGFVQQPNVGSTAEEALYNAHRESTPFEMVVDILAIKELDPRSRIIFYKNAQEGIMVALVKKKWNNKWIHIATHGEDNSFTCFTTLWNTLMNQKSLN